MKQPRKRICKPTDKQQRFIDSYLDTGCSVTAYRHAGYCHETETGEDRHLQSRAWSVLNGHAVQSAIALVEEQKTALRLRRDALTIDCLRDKMWQAYDYCWGTEVKTRDVTGALKALEMLTKTIGGFSETLNVTTDQRKEYSERERVEMKRITSLLLQPQLPIIDITEDDTNPLTEEA